MATKTKREKALNIVSRMAGVEPAIHKIVERIEKVCDLNTAAARTYYYWALGESKKQARSASRQKKAA